MGALESVAVERVDCGEVSLECALAGPEDGPLVVLLHGFPETWRSWRHQIPVLARDHRVAAPHLRGYGQSDRPTTVEAYRVPHLVADVRGLIRALGRSRAHVVGHDWGGGLAWAFALDHPEALDRLAVLNCPHPAIMAAALRSNPAQMLKSWYMFLFQIPGLAEWVMGRRDLAFLADAFVDADGRPLLSAEELEEHKEALRPDGACKAAVDYYRAAFRYRGDAVRYTRGDKIQRPTLLIWGDRDIALRPELANGLSGVCGGPLAVEHLPEASHWVQQDAPARVNELLLTHLRGPES